MNISTYYDGLIANADAELYSNASLESIELYEKTYFTFSKLAFRDYGLESYYDNNVFSTEGVGDAIKAFFKKIGEFFKWIWEQLKRFGRWIKSLFTREKEKAKEIDNKAEELKKEGKGPDNSQLEQIQKEIKTEDKKEGPKPTERGENKNSFDKLKDTYGSFLKFLSVSNFLGSKSNGSSSLQSMQEGVGVIMFKIYEVFEKMLKRGKNFSQTNLAHFETLNTILNKFAAISKEYLDAIASGRFVVFLNTEKIIDQYRSEYSDIQTDDPDIKSILSLIKPDNIVNVFRSNLAGPKEILLNSKVAEYCQRLMQQIHKGTTSFEKLMGNTVHILNFLDSKEAKAVVQLGNKVNKYGDDEKLEYNNLKFAKDYRETVGSDPDRHKPIYAAEMELIKSKHLRTFIGNFAKISNLCTRASSLQSTYVVNARKEYARYITELEAEIKHQEKIDFKTKQRTGELNLQNSQGNATIA